MTDESIKVGFLYPGYAAEDDYPYLEKVSELPVKVELVHTTFKEDAHRDDALLEMGSLPRLLQGAEKLADRQIQAVLWTSTSASFVFGWEGVKRQVETLKNALGIPASTTAIAFVKAIKTVGVKRVAVAATYPEEVARKFEAFLRARDIEVVQVHSKGIITAAEVGTLEKNEVLQLAVENDHPQAEALLIPDTALHTAAWIEELEEAVRKPVITANQVSFWEALCLTGRFQPQGQLGTLFRKKCDT